MSRAYLAFTAKGEALARRLAEALPGSVSRCGGDVTLKGWTAEHFAQDEALIFVGAVGIAVRAIAPHCKSKAADPAVVVVDEAYVDFGGVSALPLVDKYENLLVVQTFSKSRALAGMRIGFAIGQKKLISYLNDVKFSFNSYTMNRLTIACGKACVEDRAYFQEITGKIVATREWTKQKLTELGFTFPDSKANFIFATHKTVPAQELFENLKTAGIYVRYFKKPRIDNYLRITVGTQAEMERLVEVLVELVK